jgi:hypothetical protein
MTAAHQRQQRLGGTEREKGCAHWLQTAASGMTHYDPMRAASGLMLSVVMLSVVSSLLDHTRERGNTSLASPGWCTCISWFAWTGQ